MGIVRETSFLWKAEEFFFFFQKEASFVFGVRFLRVDVTQKLKFVLFPKKLFFETLNY